uniref:Thioredoxin domain-containing protein n=1 Tax=Chloropicon laureae TaxID=464258 RepID=A0A7S2YW11_9CHLO|mmetsp:Transcript_11205/g.28794  ORF Transcript_11205/g.28794 Transcript_11205/m.28794 type:complete len:120 (+) Transcript_11205:165-524(+)
MSRCLAELSRKYVGTKFVKIISTDCIANYPDQLLPTLILYKDGKVQTTLEGLAKFGGKRVTPESVAFELNSLFPDDPVVTLAGHSGEQSQQEVVKSALNRFIKESENLTLSDEEDGLFD